VLCVKGDVYHRLGLDEQAAETYRKAVEAGRGWREASYGLYVKVRGPGWASGDIGGPTDFAGARAALRAAAALEVSSDPLAEVGRRLGRAMLDYREGKFERAIPVLEELAKRFPFDAFLESHMRMAYRGRRSAGEERQFIARDAKAALPHAVVTTSRGPFTIELFQGDVGNAVSNFVWLASHGFYDGVAVHHTVPFFALQTGDPYSKAGAAHPELVGTGGPGYAIRTEGGRRRALRGYVAFANAGPDTEGSQFLVFTGTAVHLQGEVTVFGRVLAGMDVVDALRVGDRIVSVKPEGLEEGRDYRPNDVSGDPAPEPTSQR
jgi:peptidyl-prolyl cis-trans isomerase B (cyclophilin B)